MTVIATQEVFSHTKAQVWDATEATKGNTLLQDGDRFGVTLWNTVEVDAPQEINLAAYTITRPAPHGVGADRATAVGKFAAAVALDGTWEFPVTGGVLATKQGTPVYATADAAELTLTETGNALVGHVNYPATYVKEAGVLPVAIGA